MKRQLLLAIACLVMLAQANTTLAQRPNRILESGEPAIQQRNTQQVKSVISYLIEGTPEAFTFGLEQMHFYKDYAAPGTFILRSGTLTPDTPEATIIRHGVNFARNMGHDFASAGVGGLDRPFNLLNDLLQLNELNYSLRDIIHAVNVAPSTFVNPHLGRWDMQKLDLGSSEGALESYWAAVTGEEGVNTFGFDRHRIKIIRFPYNATLDQFKALEAQVKNWARIDGKPTLVVVYLASILKDIESPAPGCRGLTHRDFMWGIQDWIHNPEIRAVFDFLPLKDGVNRIGSAVCYQERGDGCLDCP